MASWASSSKTAFVAGSLLVAAGLAAGWTIGQKGTPSKQSATSGDSGGITDIDELDAAGGDVIKEPDVCGNDFVTTHDVVKIFNRLRLDLSAELVRLTREVEHMQNMTGGMCPAEELQEIVRIRLERLLTQRQASLCVEFDMDYDCLEEATWEFLQKEESTKGSGPVTKAVERFQRVWQTATREVVVGWRAGMTEEELLQKAVISGNGGGILSPQRTIEVAEIFFGSIVACAKKAIRWLKVAGCDVRRNTSANMELNTALNEAGEAALQAEGVTMVQFQASITAHRENQHVARAVFTMQAKQQRELTTMMNSA